MRLQCRITPAEQELYEHLDNIPPEYRAKRLIVMASMYLSKCTQSAGIPGDVTQPPGTSQEVQPASTSHKPKKPAGWIRDAGIQKP